MNVTVSPLSTPSSRALVQRLWIHYLAKHQLNMLVVLALTGTTAGMTALYPVVIDYAFQMFTAKDERILHEIPIVIILVTVIKAITQYIQNIQVQKIVLQVIKELQTRMFDHLSYADISRLEREAPAQLTTRIITDATAIRETLTKAVNGLADILTIIGLVGSMLYLDWLLFLIAAVMYPVAALPIQRLGRRIRRVSGGMQERMGEAAAMLNESFAQARTVRTYCLEELEGRRAERMFSQLYQSLLRMTRIRGSVDPMLEVLGGVAVAAVIGFEGWRATVTDHTLGNFTGFVAALLIASRPLRSLGSLNAAMQEGLAGLARVFGVLDEKPTILDRPNAIPLPAGNGHISFRNAWFRFPDQRIGLAGLNFEVIPGQTVALVGPSGAGKSTAISLIPRLYDVTDGSVLIDGVNVKDVSISSLRSAIAYVGQDALLFDDTIYANIAMGRPGSSQELVHGAAAAAGATAFIYASPEGYLTRVGTNGSRLSGGQRQRIALARALLRNPKILLLDEATSALDAESERAVHLSLNQARLGRTTIIISHRLSAIKDADVVVVIDQGQAVEVGTHSQLLALDGLYSRLCRSQMMSE